MLSVRDHSPIWADESHARTAERSEASRNVSARSDRGGRTPLPSASDRVAADPLAYRYPCRFAGPGNPVASPPPVVASTVGTGRASANRSVGTVDLGHLGRNGGTIPCSHTGPRPGRSGEIADSRSESPVVLKRRGHRRHRRDERDQGAEPPESRWGVLAGLTPPADRPVRAWRGYRR